MSTLEKEIIQANRIARSQRKERTCSKCKRGYLTVEAAEMCSMYCMRGDSIKRGRAKNAEMLII